jgi:hypothetical protein
VGVERMEKLEERFSALGTEAVQHLEDGEV